MDGTTQVAMAWPLLTMFGLLALFYGCFASWARRERVDGIILWGGVSDIGLVLIGLGLMSAAGTTGAILTLLYHALARLLAWVSLYNLTPRGAEPSIENLRGALKRKPVQSTLLVLGLIASFDVFILPTPEGRHYILYSAVNDGNLWLASLMAIPSTILTWISVRPILAVCFDEPDETRSLPGKDGCRAGYILMTILVVFGLARIGVIEIGSWLAGVPMARLPLLEEHWPLAVTVLYVGSFVPLVRWLMTPRVRNMYATGLMALAFVMVIFSGFSPLAMLFALIVTGIGALVACYSCSYMPDDSSKRVYWFLFLLTMTSLLGIVTAENLGSVVMFWELMSWASFFLVAWEGTAHSRSAALKYLVICSGGAFFMIPGLFALCGTTPTIAGAIAWIPSLDPLTLRFALVCIILGAAAKAGLVPVHFWLPDAHPAAPSSISAPLSGVLTKMGIFAIVAGLFLLAGDTQIARTGTGLTGVSWPGSLTILLGVLTMFFGEWRALLQDDLKRMLAYSTMGQVGEIVAVIGLGTWLSTTAGLTHVLNHAIMKDLLFLGAGAIILRTGSRKLSGMSGLVRSMPWTVGCMSIGLVSLMGLPPFNGFVSKYLMIVACMEADKPFLAISLLLASLMGAVYYLRILRTLVLDESDGRYMDNQEVPLSMRIPLVVLAGLCVVLGLFPGLGPALVTPVSNLMVALTHLPAHELPSLDVDWPVYIVIPMIGACVPIWLRRDVRRAGKATAIILFISAAAVVVFGRNLDNLSYAMAILAPLMGGLNMIYAMGYMEHSHTQWRFYTFFLLMVGGLMGVAASTSLFSFFSFWEIMSSWALYFAIAHEGTPKATREAFKYFMFNLAGAAFLFLGVGLLVGVTEVSALADIAGTLQRLDPRTATAVIGLFTAGFAIGFVMKAAQVAIYIDWQMHPAEAPTPVSGFISSVLLKIAVFGLIKLFTIFTFGVNLAQITTLSQVVAYAGAFTILYGAAKAMVQDGLKMVFIWSTVSQIGYMVVALTLGTSLGLAGSLLHVANHMLFKDLLFLAAGAVMFASHAENMRDIGGIGRKMPVTMACFTIAALATVGVPPTNGFTSKWIIYQALMQEGQVLLAMVCLVGSVLTLAYLVRFLHVVFLGQPVPHMEHAHEAPLAMRVPMVILAGGIMVTGIFPGILLKPINAIITSMHFDALAVRIGGISVGPGAWNAPGMALLVLLAFGACWFAMRRLTTSERVSDVHAGGIDPANPALRRMPAKGMLAEVAAALHLDTPRGEHASRLRRTRIITRKERRA